MTIYKICLTILMCLLNFKAAQLIRTTEVKHRISLLHPGISVLDKVDRILVEVKNGEGRALEYYMDVETVVCGDAQCKIDLVRIYWNHIGFYDRLQLPDEVNLEKAEGKHFDAEDYEKLDRILTNRNSGLKNLYKEEVVGSESTEGLDAMSGATINLHTNDYVKGAVWTCYTLWHWANGDVFSIIRGISASQMEMNEIGTLLSADSVDYQIFALEELIRRKEYQNSTCQMILDRAPVEIYEVQKRVIQYLENAPGDLQYYLLNELLEASNEKNRTPYLHVLFRSKGPIPDKFLESISRSLSGWNDYPSLTLFFNLLEIKEVSYPTLIQDIVPLLEEENFLVARRAFWFLQEKSLNEDQQEKVDTFFQKYQQRL